MSGTPNANSDLSELTPEDVEAVAGGQLQECKYRGANDWEQWIADYFQFYL